ncbi:MAG: L-seryl-tRNA(Sec) selenium transferase [Suipraeoptans sp.]
MDKNKIFRNIPKVDILLENDIVKNLITKYGRECVIYAIREETDILRNDISKMKEEDQALKQLDALVSRIEKNVLDMFNPTMKQVINATGTVLHTNLGRAPISSKHLEHLNTIASKYCNLEYNLAEGQRGERYSHFEKLICRLTGAQAAMAVNNNASSVLLILNSLAKDGEAIVSRGEQIEIGGKFRIPDVMEASGARMVEVGTTNKTHLEDYTEAITEETKAILKVHTSNYAIVGFTGSVPIDELIPAANEHDIPVIEDLGSGVLIDLSKYGLEKEPTVQESVMKGADVVCFSGDKLLGGPQAGIIVGKKKYIDIMKKNQLTRALRIDKFTAAALELVFMEYLNEDKAIENIPTLRMITTSVTELEDRAMKLLWKLKKMDLPATFTTTPCESQIGGGSMPLARLESSGVVIIPDMISVNELEERFRHLPIPIVSRIVNDEILLDVRTMEPEMFETIATMFKETKVFEG